MDPNQLGKDSKKYSDRNDLLRSNANMFISNNNNPFLISPYSPPTNIAKQTEVNNISTVISSIIGDLSSIINISSFTISISTIQPIPTDVTQTITIRASTLDIDVETSNIYGELFVEGNSYFNSISTGNIFGSVGNFSTITVSTINVNDENINFLTINSTLNASSISTGNIFGSVGNFSTLTVSTINVNDENINFLTVNSTLNASSISTGNIFGSVGNFSTLSVSTTLNASSISTGNISFITMTGTTINTSSINTSSINTTGNISFLTMSGTTINASIIISNTSISTLNISTGNLHFTMLEGNTGTISSFTFSSISMQPGIVSTATTTITSSFIINIGGIKYKIPLELA